MVRLFGHAARAHDGDRQLEVRSSITRRHRSYRADVACGLGMERPVFLAASTHAGEEAMVLEAYAKIKAVFPHCLLLLVLRHPERLPEVLPLLSGYRYVCRSQGMADEATEVFVGDTIGELMSFYAASDLTWVGGSFMPIGGHNLLEPAALGLAILTGPHFFNMKDITEQLISVGAVSVVHDANDLAAAVLALLADPAKRAVMGSAGTSFLEHNRGALARHLALVDQLLP